jgi:hypothetical protein
VSQYLLLQTQTLLSWSYHLGTHAVDAPNVANLQLFSVYCLPSATGTKVRKRKWRKTYPKMVTATAGVLRALSA